MRSEIKFFVFVFCLGAALVAYAHANFATGPTIERIFNKLDRIDANILELHRIVREKNK